MTLDVREDAAGLLRRGGKVVRPQEPEAARAVFVGQGAGGLDGFAQIGIHGVYIYTRAPVARQRAGNWPHSSPNALGQPVALILFGGASVPSTLRHLRRPYARPVRPLGGSLPGRGRPVTPSEAKNYGFAPSSFARASQIRERALSLPTPMP